ncbi:hypothetical protein WMF27_37170 [Sorangium sp. So ce281]
MKANANVKRRSIFMAILRAHSTLTGGEIETRSISSPARCTSGERRCPAQRARFRKRRSMCRRRTATSSPRHRDTVTAYERFDVAHEQSEAQVRCKMLAFVHERHRRLAHHAEPSRLKFEVKRLFVDGFEQPRTSKAAMHLEGRIDDLGCPILVHFLSIVLRLCAFAPLR